MIMSDVAHGYFLGLTDLIPESNKYILNQRIGVIKALSPTNPRFLSFYINYCQSYFKTTGQGSSQQNLSKSDILNFRVLTPPFTEQQAIAEALSDADALIEALEQLLAKKRQVKQGTMQELLTGKRRLPRYSGEWKTVSLGDIGEIDPENLTGRTSPDYSFKYISLEDVDFGVLRNYTELVFRLAPSRARRVVRNGDILISTVRPNLKSHLFIQDDVIDMICSTGFSVLRCNTLVANPAYVFFHLFAHPIERQIETLLTGSNYPAINSKDVKALQIPLPSLEEQTAIAEILSDMDTEIAALEGKLSKAREVKQGMMSELLTGRIRLVES
jgi:type I restriction enzyme S subunit